MVMYQRLVTYKEKYKTTRVPKHWKEDPRLANWVYAQRYHCKEKHRIDLLNEIGFEWDSNVVFEDRWMLMYKRLVAFKKKHKTTRVSGRWKKLKKWVYQQRCRCKEKHRIDLLNEIDFDWRRVGKK